MKTVKDIHVLIPTFKRLKALAVTLTSLYYQTESNFDIVISDQSPHLDIKSDFSIQTIRSLLELKGVRVTIIRNYPPKGMAQQRQFLLEQSNSPFSLFLDDDLILEPYVLRNMKNTLQKYGCGFAGCAVIGLSYQNDWRPHEQNIEFWDDGVDPEHITPEGDQWERYRLHNAANIFHIQQRFEASPGDPMPYKVAWVGGCVMYDTEKLWEAGGFEFWKELPENHCGEDVLAQLQVMQKYGGCGIIPSGVYHQELETTVPDRTINAPERLQISTI